MRQPFADSPQQDPVREQGPRIQRCRFRFLYIYLVTDYIKVLLYNFFEDSTATPAQWRLVLNGVFKRGNLSDVPTFDETRHASICMEVRCLQPLFFFFPLTLPGFAVEILVRCGYSGS